MVVDVVAGAVIALDVLAMGWATPRSLRRMRTGSDTEWRERFRALDPDRRKAITLAMRRGEAVRDPATSSSCCVPMPSSTTCVRRCDRSS